MGTEPDASARLGDTGEGGPDRRFAGDEQDTVTAVFNNSTGRSAQTGRLRPGGLVSWIVTCDGLPARRFCIVPPEGGWPLTTQNRRIPGRNGKTHLVQSVGLDLAEPGRRVYEYKVEIQTGPEEYKRVSGGVLVFDTEAPQEGSFDWPPEKDIPDV